MKKSVISIAALFMELSVMAQPVAGFENTAHDFGKVNESEGSANHNFAFKNTGTSPLIIRDVTTTCGCTTPEWTKQPVAPGASGFIKVSYDVKGRPGVIDKTITVHSNGKPATVDLHITGEVIPTDRSPAEAYRFRMGNLQLDNLHIAYDRIYPYEKPTLTVTAYNPGPETASISFVDLPPHISVNVTPSRIGKDEKASIKVTYNAAGKKEWGFVNDRLKMILNGDKSKDYTLMVTATIEEDFSRWTDSQLQNAPVAALDQTVVEAGKIRQGEKKEYRVKISNSGKSKLLIRKAESTSRQVEVAAPKEIAAGASAELTIRYDSSEQSGEQNKTIFIITNDPKNSQMTLRLKAEVI
ncbi:MAG: DUF1573 domain-containing protein [Bacteroidales bacterium]|jgi:hypothetical protein|nr:DUF1573 domain-containing protein [Bacteroidales bacterium]